jgi:hypothetical protein
VSKVVSGREKVVCIWCLLCSVCEKYLCKEKEVFVAFNDLEKAHDDSGQDGNVRGVENTWGWYQHDP